MTPINTKQSPFYVVPDFISPMVCEQMVDDIDFTFPETDKEGYAIKTTKNCDSAEEIIFKKIQHIKADINEHYDVQYKGMERVDFEWFTEGASGELRSENSVYIRQKWLRSRMRDLTGVVFLSDYQDGDGFDVDFEVYGGKLEFPQHHFGFNPQRGTLVLFPSAPHFINQTALVQAGDLYQARFHIATTTPYLYSPDRFPGNYTKWFNQ